MHQLHDAPAQHARWRSIAVAAVLVALIAAACSSTAADPPPAITVTPTTAGTTTSPSVAASTVASTAPPTSPSPMALAAPPATFAPQRCGLDAGACQPEGQRVDLVVPTFSHPGEITNPLFPALVAQIVQLGLEAGHGQRVESTLLSSTKDVTWPSQKVPAVTRQFIAYSDDRIVEVALDYFAQADDGSVWYLGEDVSNYQNGVVADHNGTWLAGRDGPGGMIMPATPKVGDVFRSENIPGLVFEEDTITAAGLSVPGPQGPVPGAVHVQEHAKEGDVEDKDFAPDYGEFTIHAPDESLSVAVANATDSTSNPLPAELAAIADGAGAAFDAVRSGSWTAAAAAAAASAGAWKAVQAAGVPPLLDRHLTAAIAGLTSAVAAHRGTAANAALAVQRAALDLELVYRVPAEVDALRLGPWARQVMVDAAAGSSVGVASDVAILDAIRARLGSSTSVAELDVRLDALRAAAGTKQVAAVTNAATALISALHDAGVA